MATKIWVGTDTGNEGDWATAANWLPSGVPEAADDVYLENSSQDVSEGLNQSAILLASLNIAHSYTGRIGTTSAYLQIGATLCNIGYHYGPNETLFNGSDRIKLDLGTDPSTIVVENTNISAAENGMPTVRILCNDAATTLEVRRGQVGVAFETGETSTLSKITSSYVSQIGTDANVYIGAGVTLTTLFQSGGYVVLRCAATTVTSWGGTLLTTGTGAIATLNGYGGTITSNSSGTITACTVTGGIVDFTKSATARTVTTPKLDNPGQIKFDPAVMTFTNKITSNNPVTYMASAA